MKSLLKRTIFSLGVLCATFFSSDVFAIDNNIQVYSNENDVTVTQKEYDFIKNYYGEDFFEEMTLEDLEWISDLDINNNDVTINTVYLYDNDDLNKQSSDRGVIHTTPSKKLTIAKSCSSSCIVTTYLKWLVNPTVRSYDLIGVRFHNTGLSNNTVITKLNSSYGTSYSYNTQYLSNGVGTSVLLPNGATNISVEQKVYTTLGGTVFGSYQHAISDITLQDSYNYIMSAGGYGSVFLFTNGMGNYYDAMNGVDISL